tara:strand:- start:44 stop:469 length:426 start_codon:yes stop_codon:yes gene_type:complete
MMREFKEEIRKMTKDFNRKQNIKLAIYSAELVLHLFEKKYPQDKRPRKAIAAAKKCLKSNTEENRSAAAHAADAAAHASSAAFYAAAAAATFTACAYASADAAFYASADAADASADAADASAYAKTKQNIMDYAIKLLEDK